MKNSIFNFQGNPLLDNPIWNSLTTNHAPLALGARSGRGLARRYPANISPLSALQEPTPDAYAALAAMVPEGDVAVLFLEDQPTVPDGWRLIRGGTLVQMVCDRAFDEPPLDCTIVPMVSLDFPELLALASMTEPGPFRDQTAKLGGYLGIRVGGRLAAMAGQRLSPTGYAEVSAVCTHPDFRRRGYAQALVAAVTRNIRAEGRIPFLTSLKVNAEAVRIYQRVGFDVRRTFQLAVLKPPLPHS